MGDHLRLWVGDRECRIELFEDQAPSLCHAVKQALPHTSFAVHCQTAGEEFYTNLIGRIVEGLDAMQEIGSALLAECTALPARVALLGRVTAPDRLPALPQPTTSFTLLARAFLEQTVAGIPRDILGLRTLPKPAMGNIPARFHASAALLALLDNLLGCRVLALEGSQPLTSVTATAAMLARRSIRWLGAAGLHETVDLVKQLASWLETDPPRTATGFAASTEEVLVALGRLRIWADAIAPWIRLSRDYMPDSAWLGELVSLRQ